MRRVISFLLCVATLISFVHGTSRTVSAATPDGSVPYNGMVKVSESTLQVSDDLFLVVTTYEEVVSTRATRYTKAGGKTYTFTNSNGEYLCTFTIEATYMITSGISSTCTAVSHSYEIYNSSWNYVSGSSYKSGNCAYGSAEFNRRLLGIVVETRNCDVSLACDVNGNFS